MLSVLFLQNGKIWVWLMFIGLVVFTVLGITVNYRFLILDLLWLFLVVPLMMAFLYFYFGMNPLTAFNTMPHRIEFDSDSLTVKIIHPVPPGENSGSDEEPMPQIKDYKVEFSEFKEVKRGGDYVLLYFNKDGWLWLPVYSFTSIDDFRNVLDSLPKQSYGHE